MAEAVEDPDGAATAARGRPVAGPGVPTGPRPLRIRWLGRVDYAEALELQKRLVAERRAGSIPDVLLLLEHPHVITLGAGSRPGHVLADEAERARLGIELHEVGRGGDVTYHGPGQLVGYPILDLKPDRKDLHRYLRDVEEALIRALAGLGLEAGRRAGFTGVWTAGRKVAALGVRVSSGWITSHGFALNVTTDLDFFRTIVPCGIGDRSVTSLQRELGGEVDPRVVRTRVARAFAEVFDRAPEGTGYPTARRGQSRSSSGGRNS